MGGEHAADQLIVTEDSVAGFPQFPERVKISSIARYRSIIRARGFLKMPAVRLANRSGDRRASSLLSVPSVRLLRSGMPACSQMLAPSPVSTSSCMERLHFAARNRAPVAENIHQQRIGAVICAAEFPAHRLLLLCRRATACARLVWTLRSRRAHCGFAQIFR